jgi:hypothetical protein
MPVIRKKRAGLKKFDREFGKSLRMAWHARRPAATLTD